MCSSSFGRLSFSLKNTFLERLSRTGGTPRLGAHPAPHLQLPGVGRKPEEEGRHRPKTVRPPRQSIGPPPEVLGQPPGGHQADRRRPGLHGEEDDRL